MPNYLRGAVVVAAAVVLLGCNAETRVERAERRAQIIDRSGSLAERCRDKREVAEAHLEADDEVGYVHAKIAASGACLDAAYE